MDYLLNLEFTLLVTFSPWTELLTEETAELASVSSVLRWIHSLDPGAASALYTLLPRISMVRTFGAWGGVSTLFMGTSSRSFLGAVPSPERLHLLRGTGSSS